LFLDVTYSSRIGASTLPWSGWSNAIIDFDNDGRKDLFSANGDVQDNTELFSSRSSRQRNMVLFNLDAKTFRPVFFGASALHRGAAFGDIDRDGRVDAVVTRLNEPAILLRNVTRPRNWIAFSVPVGTRIRLTAGGRQQWNEATSAVGYASSSDPTVHFGLGDAKIVDECEIRWPSGQAQTLTALEANRVITPALSRPRVP
jgi:hypothetical protein